VNTEVFTKDDLKSYKNILTMTNAHFTQHQPDGNINITRGKTFRDIIAPLFAKPKGRRVESSLRRKWTKVLMASISDLYYDEGTPAGFSTLRKLRAVEVAESKKKGKPQSVAATQAWLEERDAYTLHRSVSERFARNPYTVTNVGDVWECDLLDLQSYAKYSNIFWYII